MSYPLKTEHLSIPSTPDQLEVIDNVVEAMAADMGFDKDALADLGICVTEAVMNAIEHAHRDQPDLFIDLTIECYADRMKITVRDHGPGFDEDAVPDPTTPQNVLNLGGRGLMLMRAMMDEVEVRPHDDGTEISMVKKLVNSKK
ncbi:ATP-binding protein [bacterium]|nr:ATP-binding protein [bacterium]MBU1637445.1 ATP-binding protein [bacterium]MBU1920562.1 ATP-binding protein [bacterium]